MVEFRADLGTWRALESGPRLQLGARPEDAAAGGLLRALVAANRAVIPIKMPVGA
jgi:hypothetical protein